MDKNKIIEAAAKLVAKGAYDKAIKEYQKILDADPKDVRILQKMGELYQKKNDNVQAAHFFTKVAESYASDGFFLKAVALYKQVLKLDPSLMDVNLKLAELHQQLQLMGEAMAYFQIVANHYDKSGDTKRSLDTLRKMVDLDPDNVASRIKLADLYARENMVGDAASEYRRAADHLKRNGRLDDYVRVAERITAMEPTNVVLARELAEVYLQKADHKRALAKLQVCFKADPRDVETLKLLATAFEGLGQASKTVSVYKELAKILVERGQQAEVDRIWRQIEALDPNDPEVVSRRPAVPSRAPARAAAPAPSRAVAAQPAPAAQPATAQVASAPSRLNIGKLLTETDVYVKYGLHDKALEHLRKVFEVEPENIDAHEKAYEIYVASNNSAQAGEQLLNVLRLHTRRGDQARAAPFLQTMLQNSPNHPEVPAFLAVLQPDTQGSDAEAMSGDAEEAIVVDASDEEVVVSDSDDDFGNEDPNQPVVLVPPEPGSGAWAAPQLNDDEPLSVNGADSSGEVDFETDDVVSEEIELESAETELPADQYGQSDFENEAAVAEQQAFDAEAGRRDHQRTLEVPQHESDEQNWEGVDATPAEARVPDLPEGVDETGAYTDSTTAPRGLPTAEPEVQPLDEAQGAWAEAPGEQAVEAPPDDEPASEECDEASFFIDQGLLEEGREIVETVLIAYPDHRRARGLLARIEAGGGPATDEMPAAARAAPPPAMAPADDGPKDAFDLAAELAEELDELDLGGTPEPAGNTGDFQVSFEEVFSEFKKGLQKVVKPEDVETHYDLGIAYKEMGLIDDAIGEFVVSRQGCAGKKKEVDCLTMLGMLHSMQGDFAAAIEDYRQALVNETVTGETELALRYELATAHEQAGSPGKALGHLIHVQQVNPGYRDVSARVEQLSQTTAPEDDAQPPPPRPRGGGGGGSGAAARKVGYV